MVSWVAALPGTCAIRGSTHVGGQHLDRGSGMSLLAQTPLHFYFHPPLDLQQLLTAQLQRLQGLLANSMLVSQPVGHCRHHGCPLATAIFGAEEADITVGYQAPHGLVKALGETAVMEIGHETVSMVMVSGTHGWGTSSPAHMPGGTCRSGDPLPTLS